MKRSWIKRGIKKRSPTWYRKKCVVWAKNEAKKKAKYQCEYCGRTKKEGWQMHGSHILNEGVYVSMSADPENILCLCATHHIAGMSRFIGRSSEPSWHGDPLFFAKWFNNKWPGRYEKLLLKARELKGVDWEKRWKQIRAQPLN